MTAPRHPGGQPRPPAPPPGHRREIIIAVAACLAVLAGIAAATRSIPLGGTLVVAALFTGYWAPTVIAHRRHAPDRDSILIINLLLGWTLAGWAVAMARAVRQLPCRASISNSHPERYTTTYVHVSTVKYATVTTIAHYKTGSRQRSGTANARGRESIPYHIGGATPGYRVNVSVAVTSGTRQGKCATSFTPQRAQLPGHQRTHPGGAAPNPPRARGRYQAASGRVPAKRTPGLAAACRRIASRPTRRSGDDQ